MAGQSHRKWFLTWAGSWLVAGGLISPLCAQESGSTSAGSSSAPSADFAKTFWTYITEQSPYQRWAVWSLGEEMRPGHAPHGPHVKTYINRQAAGDLATPRHGSILVTENYADDKQTLSGITVMYKAQKFNPKQLDWYWLTYRPDGSVPEIQAEGGAKLAAGRVAACINCHTAASGNDFVFSNDATPVAALPEASILHLFSAEPAAPAGPFAKAGFETVNEEGRLWVFQASSAEFQEFQQAGELAKHVTMPGAGPNGMTLKAPDSETILKYVAAKPGFVTQLEEGRVWVFREGAAELEEFKTAGELAKHVIRPGMGPLGATLKAPDNETILEYTTAKPGFITRMEEGRLWIFRAGSPEWQEFQTVGELAKHVIRPGAGPMGLTIKAPDAETILAYLTAREGFVTKIEDERLWVFRADAEELKEFEAAGELAKHVILPGAGPMGITVKAPDRETIDAYLAATASNR